MDQFRTAATNCGQPEATASDSVSFRRRGDLPGVEVRSVEFREPGDAQGFCSYSSDFEFLAASTFHGELWHRRRWRVAYPGRMLAARPGDLFRVRRVFSTGRLSSLILDATRLHGYLADHQVSLDQLRLEPYTVMSSALHERFTRALTAVDPANPLMASQTSIVEFVAAMLVECRCDLRLGPVSEKVNDAVAHARQRLQHDTIGRVDLETLAEETGLSRFQLLRSFKRQFGLPPHTYRMRVRIALAQKMLRDGVAPAGVAAELGFVDQSHMTRHFKRAVGLTPTKYAKSTLRAS